MTHSSPDFAQHVLGLLKKTGTTGTSGHGPGKPLPVNEKDGTSRTPRAVPVENDWYRPMQSSGTNKVTQKQLLAEGVTSGTSGTTNFQQGADEPGAGAAPVEWRAILAELERQECPDWIAVDRWQHMLSDVGTFLTRWGSTAHSLGWTALDLFGVHPLAPSARFDAMGLLLLTQGSTVVALTAEAATLRRVSGAVLTYRRDDMRGAALLSEVPS